MLKIAQQRKSQVKEKRQPSEWKKILANKDTHKEFISNTYKQHVQCSIKTQTIQLKQSTKGPNAHFSKEGVEMAIKHIKRCSASRVLREKQIKCTMRSHLTLIKMALSKILQQ